MTPAPNLQEIIDTIRRDAGSDNPLDQLATAATTVNELSETSDAALGFFVDRARGAGHSWVEISAVLGVTKQAAHKRFAVSATRPTLDRFTNRAQRVIAAASGIALVHNHGYIGTEHLLLALYSEPDAIAGKILLAHDITAAAVTAAVREIVPDGDEAYHGEPPFTPRASHVLQGAVEVAVDMGHNYVGTEHLLLALYRYPGGIAVRVLRDLGLEEDAARESVVEALRSLRS
jgi:Clp amino terminal domain, pathogenicity island component